MPPLAGELYAWLVTRVKQPKQPRVEVLQPADALHRAAELPRRDQLVIEDVPDLDWTRFQQALTEA